MDDQQSDYESQNKITHSRLGDVDSSTSNSKEDELEGLKISVKKITPSKKPRGVLAE